MEIQQLQYFISVAKHLNFTVASKELFISQAAISKQISNLEKELNVKLLDRNTRFVQLTQAGEIFLEEAIEIINRIDNAVLKMEEATTDNIGILKIGLLGASEGSFLTGVIKSFKKKYPFIKLSFEHAYPGPLKGLLLNGDIDIAILFQGILENHLNIESQDLFTDYTVIICSHEHPLAHEKKIHMSSLSNYDFIILNRESSAEGYELMKTLCISNGFKPKIVSEPNSFEHLIMQVKAGLRISIIPQAAVSYYGKNEVKRILISENPLQYQIKASWDKENKNPAIQSFIEEINIHKSLNS